MVVPGLGEAAPDVSFPGTTFKGKILILFIF